MQLSITELVLFALHCHLSLRVYFLHTLLGTFNPAHVQSFYHILKHIGLLRMRNSIVKI